MGVRGGGRLHSRTFKKVFQKLWASMQDQVGIRTTGKRGLVRRTGTVAPGHSRSSVKWVVVPHSAEFNSTELDMGKGRHRILPI